MEKFCTKTRIADCLDSYVATKYSRVGFLSKHLAVVAVVFIKTAAYIKGRVILILKWPFARVMIKEIQYILGFHARVLLQIFS